MGLGIERFMRHFGGRADLTVQANFLPLSIETIREAKKILFEYRPDKDEAGLSDILLIAPQSLVFIENSIRDSQDELALKELQNKNIEGLPYEICQDLPYMTYIDKEYGTEALDTHYRYYERANFLVTQYNVVRIFSMEEFPHAKS